MDHQEKTDDQRALFSEIDCRYCLSFSDASLPPDVVASTKIVGTKQDDVLSGTLGDDVIRPKLDHDQFDGNAGFDTLIVDYSDVPLGGGLGSSVFVDNGVLGGSLTSFYNFCIYQEIEK